MKSKLMLSLVTGLVLFSQFYARASAQERARASVSHGIVFLPLDFYSRNSEALGLDEDQQHEIDRILEELAEATPKFTAELNERSRLLQEAVGQHPPDMDVAVSRFKAVMEAEAEMKSLQFKVRMKMRAVLRPEQFERVKAIVANAVETDAASGDMLKKLQQVRKHIHQQFGDTVPQELISKLEEIEQTARKGHTEEASQRLDAVMKHLSGGKESGQEGVKQQLQKLQDALKNASDREQREQIEQQMKRLKEQHGVGKATFGGSHRSPEEVQEQIRRVEEFAKQTEDPELKERLKGAVGKLKKAEAAENYEAIIEILGSVKQLAQDHGK